MCQWWYLGLSGGGGLHQLLWHLQQQRLRRTDMLLVSNGKGLANTLQCNIMQEVPGNASGWYPHTEWGLDAVVTLSQDYERPLLCGCQAIELVVT